MNNFGKYITPEEAYKHSKGVNNRTLKYYQELTKATGRCIICGIEDIWKYARTGLCFSCTTGEADASDDYELIGNWHQVNSE